LPPPVWPPSYPDWWAILVLRGQTFAGHALGHVGFAGASGAILIGVASVWGLIVFTVAAGIAMGLMGDRISGRDVAIGVVLALALGFGLLFLHYYTAFAAQATALLFGMDVRRRYPNSKDNC
jgi:zinc/manganese transport system permease protein